MFSRILAVLLICVFSISASEVSLGVDLNINVNNQNEDWDENNGTREQTTTTSSFGVSPYLILGFDKIEVVPNIGFKRTAYHQKRTSPDGQIQENNNSSFGAWGGCGVFFRVIDREPFRLSLGPDLRLEGNDNVVGPFGNFDFQIGLPINVDFRITDQLFFRMSPRFINMTFGFGNDNNYHKNSIDVSLETFWQPRFGFYWTF